MAPEGKPLFSLREGDTEDGKAMKWSYRNKSRTPGAFRAISVKHLRETPSRIRVYEWRHLRSPNPEAKRRENYPDYAAISHVWHQSDEVLRLARKAKRNLGIKTEGRDHWISWLGLQQVANAAHTLGCDYLWLDLVCMDQVPRDRSNSPSGNDGEKALQISNMGTIYKHAATVIIMVGGVSAVQGIDHTSCWMDRAWTLQEAAICPRHTWVYVDWPYETSFKYGSTHYHFKDVEDESTNHLIPLLRLLEMPDLSTVVTVPPLKTPPNFKERCLDGLATGRGVGAARAALLIVIKAANRSWRIAGIWRSIFLRNSTHPVDIAYSVMGLLEVELDPYRKQRDVRYLLNDLATKTAAKGHPGWFCVSPFEGSQIPRNSRSGLIPMAPSYQKQKLPFYRLRGGRKALTSEFVDCSKTYIRRYDIMFKSSSLPHIVCACMFRPKITSKIVRRSPHQSRVFLSIGTCTYRGEIGDKIVIVGKIESWETSKLDHIGAQYFLFVSWRKNRWSVTGDGYLRVKNGAHLPQARTHFIIGRSSPKIKNWVCDCKANPKPRKLFRSYGIMPYVQQSPERRFPIKWIAYKGQTISTYDYTWHHLDIFFSSELLLEAHSIGLRFPEHWELYLVVCNSYNQPKYATEARPDTLFQYNRIPMEYTENSLGNAPLELWLKLAKAQVDLGAMRLLAAVEFRREVVYLITKPHKYIDHDFRHIAVAEYKMEHKRVPVAPTALPRGITWDIAQPPQPQPPPPYPNHFPTSDQEWINLRAHEGYTGDMPSFRNILIDRLNSRR